MRWLSVRREPQVSRNSCRGPRVGMASPTRSIPWSRCGIRLRTYANYSTGLAILDLQQRPTMRVQLGSALG